MRVRLTTALGFAALTLLTVPACSTDTAGAKPAAVSSTQRGRRPVPPRTPLRCRRPH